MERATNGKTQDSDFQAALLKNSLCGLWWDTSPPGHSFFSYKTGAVNKSISKGPSRMGIPPFYGSLREGKESKAEMHCWVISSQHRDRNHTSGIPFSLYYSISSYILSLLALANHVAVKLIFHSQHLSYPGCSSDSSILSGIWFCSGSHWGST